MSIGFIKNGHSVEEISLLRAAAPRDIITDARCLSAGPRDIITDARCLSAGPRDIITDEMPQ